MRSVLPVETGPLRGLPEPPLDHLERRQALHEEVAGRSRHPLHLPDVVGVLQRAGQGGVVDARQVQHAQLLPNRLPSELVCGPKCGLPGPVQVLAERRGVRVLQPHETGRHCDRPRYRTTSTSASSVPFPSRSRIRAATSRGEPERSGDRAALLLTPSVARTSVSPGRTGSVSGCRGGSRYPRMPTNCTTDSDDRDPSSPSRNSVPSTLPTPTHVTVSSAARNDARLMTTPRVRFSASWDRSKTRSTGSPADPSTTSAATRAARTASGPWPIPSAAAATAPPANDFTMAMSPDSGSPGMAWAATPHSRSGRSGTPGGLPFLHGHPRALPWLRIDLELVHEAPGPR